MRIILLCSFSRPYHLNRIPPIIKKPRRPRALALGLEILYEDKDVLVIDKPAGVLSMASEREPVRTAYYVMTDYVRKGQAKSRNRVFIVHRLDRETSGVLIFAKTEESKRRMQDNWENTDKRYLAVVHGRTPVDEGSITSYLAESEAFRVYSTQDATKGKFSQTEYRVLKRTPAFSFLELALTTGRKNQIRVHCADEGFPIAGDKKYGKENDVHPRMALHAYKVSFEHPVTRKIIHCTAPVPAFFKHLLGPIEDLLTPPEDSNPQV